MNYEKIVEGIFLSRPNRFIAKVLVEGREETVHVKNTGRCKELLQPGVKVYLSDEDGKERKTRYDLVAVDKAGRTVNMDSQAPNMAVREWLTSGGLFSDVVKVRPEYTYGDSRVDFLVTRKNGQALIEVKGVTLENNNMTAFPDAPSERAVKHVEELIRAVKEGYECYVLFVIQMEGVDYLIPNDITHKAFGDSLRKAREAGVKVVAWDTRVTPGEMVINHPIPVYLYYEELFHQMGEPLLNWYDKGHRSLPWREDPCGYKVWLSEIMLQQTRVEAVKPYFNRFLSVLPDICSLSQVEEETLLKLWEGLGYYNRARNLQKAARMIMEEYGGQMPSAYGELRRLPGIGSYTAGAIASIAFGERVPAVDGNVLRVLSRLTMNEEDITKEETKRLVEAKLKEAMPPERPGDFNQALMELGAMVCLPKGRPKCEECPWVSICLAHREGREEEFPKKKEKKPRTIEKKTILVVQDENKSALRKRPDKGLLAGMYEFPTLEGHQTKKRVLAYLEAMGLVPLRIEKLAPSKHVFSHREWHMIGYVIRVDELAPKSHITQQEQWIFTRADEAQEKYPLPSAYGAYADFLNITQGSKKLHEWQEQTAERRLR